MLDELVRSNPAVGVEAERIARAHLIDTDVELVAEAVAYELRHLASDELVGRAGKHRWGYVEPTEAAWQLLEEATGDFEQDVERLLKLDMVGPAVDAALATVCTAVELRRQRSHGRPISRSSTPHGWSTASPNPGSSFQRTISLTWRPSGHLD